MANITWRDVQAPDFSQAAQLADMGRKSINDAVTGIGAIAEKERQGIIGRQDTSDKAALEQALTGIRGLTDPKQIAEASLAAYGNIPESQREAFRTLTTGMEDRALTNLGLQQDQTLKGKEIGAFDRNTELSQNLLAAQGKDASAKADVASTLYGAQANKAVADVDLTKANAGIAQEELKFKPQTLEAELSLRNAQAKDAGIIADNRQRTIDSTVRSQEVDRQVALGNLNLKKAEYRLAKDRLKHDIEKSAKDALTGKTNGLHLEGYMKALKSGDMDAVAKFQGLLADGDVSAAHITAAQNAVAGEKFQDLSGSYKPSKGFEEATKETDPENRILGLRMLDKLQNDKGVVEIGGTKTPLNKEGIRVVQDVIARRMVDKSLSKPILHWNVARDLRYAVKGGGMKADMDEVLNEAADFLKTPEGVLDPKYISEK